MVRFSAVCMFLYMSKFGDCGLGFMVLSLIWEMNLQLHQGVVNVTQIFQIWPRINVVCCSYFDITFCITSLLSIGFTLFHSVLTLLVGQQEGHVAYIKLGVGLLVVMICLELCTSYSSTSHHHLAAIILCFSRHRLTQVHPENDQLNRENALAKD